MRPKWQPQHIDWLGENYPLMPRGTRSRDLAQAFNAHFNLHGSEQRSACSIAAALTYYQITRKHPDAWTEAENERLCREYPDTVTATLAQRMGRTLSSIYRQVRRLGIRKSAAFMAGPHAERLNNERAHAARFRKGNVPWNKGHHYEAGGRSEKTRFRSGSRGSRWVPIGTERVNGEGYRERKVADTRDRKRNWKSVHVLLWQEQHGPIPKGHVVVFRDGDKSNLSLENLACVSRGVMAWVNHQYPDLASELRPTAITLAQVREKVVRAERGLA